MGEIKSAINNTFVIGFMLTGLFLFICGCSVYNFSQKSGVAAMVNDVPIYVKEVENVYKQYQDKSTPFKITRQGILQNAINETLVLLEAKKRGITISESEVEKRIEDLKLGYPELYKKVLEKETPENYKLVLKDRMIYEKMKRIVLQESGVTTKTNEQNAYNWYLSKKEDSNREEFEKNKTEIMMLFREAMERKVFNDWNANLRKTADIKILYKE